MNGEKLDKEIKRDTAEDLFFAILKSVKENGHYVIKKDQYARLKAAYNELVSKLFGGTAQPQINTETKASSPPQINNDVYKVTRLKTTSGNSQLLELLDAKTNEILLAYVRKDDAIKEGVLLKDIDISKKTGPKGPYNILDKYKIAG